MPTSSPTSSPLAWRLTVAVFYALLTSVVAAVVHRLLGEVSSSSSSSSSSYTSQVSALVTWPSSSSSSSSSPSSSLTLADVGGHAEVKRELEVSVLTPLRHPAVFYGGPRAVRPPRGVLLHGPPGTGKTLLARAVASEAGVPLLSLTAASLESKWWGETPKLLQAVFREARTRYAPCLLFFDEIDGLGRARQEQDQSCVYSLKCELLRNLDSLEDAAVVVLACTNCPSSLDPALRRRFQRVLHVELPDEEDRLGILRVIAKDERDTGRDRRDRRGGRRDKEPTVDAREVARRTAGFSGADLATLYENASARRLREVVDHLDGLRDGEDLLRRLGPLTREHWEGAAKGMGKELGA